MLGVDSVGAYFSIRTRDKPLGPLGENQWKVGWSETSANLVTSLRLTELDIIRLPPSTLPPLHPPQLPRRPGLPNHRPTPHPNQGFNKVVANPLSYPLAKRPLPSKRAREILLAVWSSERGRVCVSIL